MAARKQRGLTEALQRQVWRDFEATAKNPRKRCPEETVVDRALRSQPAETWHLAAKSSEAAARHHSSAPLAGTLRHLSRPFPRQTSQNPCAQVVARAKRSLSEGNPELPEMHRNSSVQARPRAHRLKRSFAKASTTRERRSLQAARQRRSAQGSATEATVLRCTTPEQT